MDDDKKTPLIATVGTVVVAGVGVLANLTGILDWLGIKPNQPQETAVVETSITETAPARNAEDTISETISETIPESESITETALPEVSDTEMQTETEIQLEHEIQTESETATLTDTFIEEDLIKVDSTFHVTNIATVSEPLYIYRSWNAYASDYLWEETNFFTYDSFSETLYYLDSHSVIQSYNIKTGETKNIVDVSKENSNSEPFGYLTFNPYSETVYVEYFGSLYDITNDKLSIDVNYFRNSPWESTYFTDKNTVVQIDTSSSAPLYSIISLSTKDFIKRSIYFDQIYPTSKELADFNNEVNLNPVSRIYPFLKNDCYYWFMCGYNQSYALIIKSNQLFPDRHSGFQFLNNCKDIINFHVGQDAVYYIDKNKNIYEYNLDAEHQQDTLLTSAENPDILLVNGANIENTATTYLSEQIGRFIVINNSTFVFYDMSDNTLKLVSAE